MRIQNKHTLNLILTFKWVRVTKQDPRLGCFLSHCEKAYAMTSSPWMLLFFMIPCFCALSLDINRLHQSLVLFRMRHLPKVNIQCPKKIKVQTMWPDYRPIQWQGPVKLCCHCHIGSPYILVAQSLIIVETRASVQLQTDMQKVHTHRFYQVLLLKFSTKFMKNRALP